MRSSTLVLIAFVSGLLRSTAPQPCLRGEQRVCKHQAASQEPKKQHRLRVLPSRETVSVFLGGSRLMRAEGSALSPSERRRQPPKCCTTPTTGCSPCAADCTGRLTVGMTRDFGAGEAAVPPPPH